MEQHTWDGSCWTFVSSQPMHQDAAARLAGAAMCRQLGLEQCEFELVYFVVSATGCRICVRPQQTKGQSVSLWPPTPAEEST